MNAPVVPLTLHPVCPSYLGENLSWALKLDPACMKPVLGRISMCFLISGQTSNVSLRAVSALWSKTWFYWQPNASIKWYLYATAVLYNWSEGRKISVPLAGLSLARLLWKGQRKYFLWLTRKEIASTEWCTRSISFSWPIFMELQQMLLPVATSFSYDSGLWYKWLITLGIL